MWKTSIALVVGFGLFAQNTTYLVLLKGTSALAYYSANGQLQATIPLGEHPHEMVFSPDRRTLYTTDNGTMRVENAGAGGNSLSIIDVGARKKVGEIVLGQFRRPHGVDVDPKTGRLVVTAENPDKLLLVDPNKRSVLKTFDTKGKTPHMVTFGPGAAWAYVSNSGSGSVAAVNVETGQTHVIATGARPEGSVLSRDGKELYVANRDGEGITVIDTTKQQAIALIQTGKGPVRIAITPDGSQLAYALMYEKKVAFADPKARRQTDYVLLPNQPVSCNLSRDGKFALVSAEEQNTIYVISVAEKKIVREIRTPQGTGPDPVFGY